MGSVREARRKDAYRQMSESCGGHYKIDTEGEQVSGGTVVANPIGNGVIASAQQTHNWYIQFSCVRP